MADFKHMETLVELLKILIPSGLLLIGMYLLSQSLLNKLFEQKTEEAKRKTEDVITPLRLQAYERMTLFLERISPDNLLLRLHSQVSKVGEFQALLIREIREEYTHNLAQQIYIKPETWDEIKLAKNEMLQLINQSASELDADEHSVKLSKKIFDKVMSEETMDPTAKALHMLKLEVQELF